MPIPVANSHELLLRSLLDKQVNDFDAWVDVAGVVETLPKVDRHTDDAGRVIPLSVLKDVEYLEQHRLLEFRRDNPHVRLTSTGVYTALFFDIGPKQ